MYRVLWNQAAPAYSSLYFFIFLSLQFSNIEIFRHTFLRNFEAYKVETWYTRGQWADVSCNRSQAAAAYLSLYSSFFFLSNFQTLKFFVTFFSGTVRSRRFKLGTHVDNWQLYRVYRNQAASAYIHPFISSFFFLSNFLTLKFFVTLFSGTVRPRRLKLGTHVNSGQSYRVYWNQAVLLICPFIFHFSFSWIFKQENFSSHFSQELWGLEG